MTQLIPFGGAGTTLISPVVLVAMVVAIILVLVLPRRYVILPLLATGFLIPLGQQVVVVGLHFMVLRILILFGWIRMVAEKFLGGGQSRKLNTIDKALLLWLLSSVLAFLLLWRAWGALINQLGFTYNVFGAYFLFRFLIRDRQDVERAIKFLAVIAAVLAVCMVNEYVTGRNVFGLLGGVPVIDLVRDGRIRSQGAFAHPILAGTFGATLLALFIGLWQSRRSRGLATLGALSAMLITLTSNSSTPALAYAAAIVGLCMWPLRNQMRLVRWGIVATLAGLHLVMKAPVWALIARIDVTGGSSGYQRYMLVDNCIRRFWDWWLIGTTSNWQWGWYMWDQANQYVAIAQGTGLLPLILFISIIVLCFKCLGIARKSSQEDRRSEWFLWALGAALFSHLVAFMGISYFDQTFVSWYLLLVMIPVASLTSNEVRVPQLEPKEELMRPRLLSVPSASGRGAMRRSSWGLSQNKV